jgi:predicted SnoaL-like aldol condensation-catalyzing enzyme
MRDRQGPRGRLRLVEIDFRIALVRGDREAVFEFWAPEFVSHVTERVNPVMVGSDVRGQELEWWTQVRSAFPDMVFTVELLIESGDLIVSNWMVRGTHTGSAFYGVAPSGEPVTINGTAILRMRDGKIVEHWGGQEPEAPPNLSGRTQVDGPTEVLDREKTDANRTLVRTYRETVMGSLRFDRIEEFMEDGRYAQHASKIGDGIARLRDRIAAAAKEGGQLSIKSRRFVAEGNFVLVLSEGDLPSGSTALYDLFRVESGKIVEHWDVLAPIPARDRWQNTNGPF